MYKSIQLTFPILFVVIFILNEIYYYKLTIIFVFFLGWFLSGIFTINSIIKTPKS